MNYENIKKHPDMKNYFDSLSEFERVSVIHSGVEFNSLDEMQACVARLSADAAAFLY